MLSRSGYISFSLDCVARYGTTMMNHYITAIDRRTQFLSDPPGCYFFVYFILVILQFRKLFSCKLSTSHLSPRHYAVRHTFSDLNCPLGSSTLNGLRARREHVQVSTNFEPQCTTVTRISFSIFGFSTPDTSTHEFEVRGTKYK